MDDPRLLIANRGEVAARVAQSARPQGYRCVGVCAQGDGGLYLERMDAVVELAVSGVAAYLDIDAMVTAAISQGCTAVHPGWGFLAENAEFGAVKLRVYLVKQQFRLFPNAHHWNQSAREKIG